MQGSIDGTTENKLQAMLSTNPINTLVMLSVPSSGDDAANIAMAKTLTMENIATLVPENGIIAPGGVDLFLAGTTRSVKTNALVGVHSWADEDDTQGIDLYNNDPDAESHLLYIDYYDQLVNGMKDGRPGNEITNIATDSYVFTLQTAPAQGLHCMTPAELVDWGIVTNTTGPSTLSTLVLGQSEACTH